MKLLGNLSIPLRVGLGFGALGILLTVIGIARGNVPANPASIGMALLIGGGVWFLVSWAVATAAVDVEQDMHPPESGTDNHADNHADDTITDKVDVEPTTSNS